MDKIFQRLQKNRKRAMATYSHYHVGALAITDKGVFDGFNIECSVYPLTACAEQVALLNALAHGAKRIDEMAIVTDSTDGLGTPCGSCRQLLADHMKPDGRVVVYDPKGNRRDYTVSQLLPHAFTNPEKTAKESNHAD